MQTLASFLQDFPLLENLEPLERVAEYHGETLSDALEDFSFAVELVEEYDDAETQQDAFYALVQVHALCCAFDIDANALLSAARGYQ